MLNLGLLSVAQPSVNRLLVSADIKNNIPLKIMVIFGRKDCDRFTFYSFF